MVNIPRWARAKVRTAGRRRRSDLNKRSQIQKPTPVIMEFKQGNDTIKYRDHLRSHQRDLAMPDVTKWHGYPTEFVAFLSCFDKVPDDQLPPLVAVTRRLKQEWQSTIKGQGIDRTICLTVSVEANRHLFCFLGGKQAYFVLLSHIQGYAKRSANVTSDFAHLCIDTLRSRPDFDLERTLTWIEEVDYQKSTA